MRAAWRSRTSRAETRPSRTAAAISTAVEGRPSGDLERLTTPSPPRVPAVARAPLTCYIRLVSDQSTVLDSFGLNDRVYAIVKDWIVTRRVAPGAQLNLRALAADFGVSRSPVYHALNQLCSDGLVSVRSRHGYFVSPLTYADVSAGFGVRQALELQAAEAVVGKLIRLPTSRACGRLRRRRPQQSTTTGPSTSRGTSRATAPFTRSRSTSPGTRCCRRSTAGSRSTS